MQKLLFYYKKTDVSDKYLTPDKNWFKEIMYNIKFSNISYEEFLEKHKKLYEQDLNKRYSIKIETKVYEDVNLNSIKDTIKKDNNFISFVGEPNEEIDNILNFLLNNNS